MLRHKRKHKPTWKLSRKYKPTRLRTSLPTTVRPRPPAAPAAYICIRQRRTHIIRSTSAWWSLLCIPSLTGSLRCRRSWARCRGHVHLPWVQSRVKCYRSTQLRCGRISPACRASSTRRLFSPRHLCTWNESLRRFLSLLSFPFLVEPFFFFFFYCLMFDTHGSWLSLSLCVFQKDSLIARWDSCVLGPVPFVLLALLSGFMFYMCCFACSFAASPGRYTIYLPLPDLLRCLLSSLPTSHIPCRYPKIYISRSFFFFS